MIKPVVFVLVMMFGSSTWMTINAIWVELSLYTGRLPEGWDLPSYLAAVIQVACLLTLGCSITHKYTRFNANKAPLILTLMGFASLCMLMLALFWKETLYIFGAEHSVPLIGLTFLMSLVCAASNMIFLPYMATFHPTYMTAYFIGMSFSSLYPSVIKLIQGVGSDKTSKSAPPTEPLFHVQIYNLLIFVWMCAATLAFAVLHWKFGQANSEKEDNESAKNGQTVHQKADGDEADENGNGEQSPLKPEKTEVAELAEQGGSVRYWTLISCLALISAEMNTIVPSIQSYATLPYSTLTYHLALTISNISHPVANLIPIWFKPRSMPFILCLVFVCTASTAFIFMLALQSPEPMLHDSTLHFGSIFSIGASVIAGFLCSYLRIHLTSVVRNEHANDESALFWCGFFMQIGSFVGACVMFPLVNYFKIFKAKGH